MTRSTSPRCRARDLGIAPGRYRPGAHNAITDVAGVRVGHATIIRGKGAHNPGRGPVRTGVTAILPRDGDVFHNRVVGGCFVLNGAGEVAGLTQVAEWGLIETPILLTNTLDVGTCSSALVEHMVATYPSIGREAEVIIPVVGECDDSWLNDIAGRHVKRRHVFDALENARRGPVAEGSVGGGTGMITCGFKAGIGTSSRVLAKKDGGYTLGVLVMSNFGLMEDLIADGVPVGRALEKRFAREKIRNRHYGSLIAVVATDAPMQTHQLSRLCTRAALGIGRMGSYAAHTSGEIVLGFSTGNTVPRRRTRLEYQMTVLHDNHMDPLYQAAVETTEEAILNALCAADTMDGIDDHVAPALPLDALAELTQHRRK